MTTRFIQGNVSSQSSPAGVVQAFAGSVAPSGWLTCDGAAVSRTTYAALFAAIGISHGSGDGSTTFNVPDYRGRMLRGGDSFFGGTAANRDPDKASRTAMNAGGNTGNAVGSVQGQATKTPTTSFTTAAAAVTGTANTGVNLAHGHGITDPTHAHQLVGANPSDGSGTYNRPLARSTTTFTNVTVNGGSDGVNFASTGITVNDSTSLDHSHSLTGIAAASTVNGGGDNETRPINAYVNYIIKV